MKQSRKITHRVAITAVATLGLSLAAPVGPAQAELVQPDCDLAAYTSSLTDGVTIGDVIDALPDIGPERSTLEPRLCGQDVDSPAPDEEWTQEEIDARYAAFRERTNQLLEEGKSQAEVATNIAEEFGIYPIGIGPPEYVADPQLLVSSGMNVVMYTPTFSYDMHLRKYVMSASWAWNQCGGTPCWHAERTSPGNLGGPDGMAIKINRPIFRYSAGLSTNNNCGKPAIWSNQPDTDNGHGVAFIEQDTVSYAGTGCLGVPVAYNWHRGTISEAFLFQSNCAGIQLQIDSKIGHTWSSTSVNSVGISAWGISFSWSSSDHRWNAIPTTPAYAAC